MREGDYGLFVTLFNYTKNAQKYLENTPIIRGINGTELVQVHCKYYGVTDNRRAVGKFIDECRSLIFKWLNRRSQVRGWSRETPPLRYWELKISL